MKKITSLFALMLCLVLLPALIFAQTNQLKKGYGMQKTTETPNEFKEKPVVDYSHKYTPSGSRMGGEDIASAVVIPALPFNDVGNTCSSINDYDEACPYTGGTAPDVVYSYTPTADDIINIDLCNSGYDTKVFVYENAYTPGSPYACNDDNCPGFRSLIENLSVTAGNTYYIVIDGYGGDCGDYDLLIEGAPPPPDNNLCANAEPIVCGTVVSGTTLNATVDGAPYCDYSNTAPGVWYTFEAYAAEYTLSLCSFANFDTKISVYTGDCNNLVCVGGNDDFCGLTSEITISTAGNPFQTYYVLVHGFSSAQGDFELTVTCNEPFSIPVSNWAIVAGILMIGFFLVFRYRRKLA